MVLREAAFAVSSYILCEPSDLVSLCSWEGSGIEGEVMTTQGRRNRSDICPTNNFNAVSRVPVPVPENFKLGCRCRLPVPEGKMLGCRSTFEPYLGVRQLE